MAELIAYFSRGDQYSQAGQGRLQAWQKPVPAAAGAGDSGDVPEYCHQCGRHGGAVCH